MQAGVTAEVIVTLHREDIPDIAGRVLAELVVFHRHTYPIDGHYKVSYQLSGTIIGNAQLVESLAPTSPFVRQRRQTIRPRRNVNYSLHGEGLSFRLNVNYVVAMPGYEIPGALRDALVESKREDQEDEIAQRLPGGLTATLNTHGRYWSTLLHVEELQVEYVVLLFCGFCDTVSADVA